MTVFTEFHEFRFWGSSIALSAAVRKVKNDAELELFAHVYTQCRYIPVHPTATVELETLWQVIEQQPGFRGRVEHSITNFTPNERVLIDADKFLPIDDQGMAGPQAPGACLVFKYCTIYPDNQREKELLTQLTSDLGPESDGSPRTLPTLRVLPLPTQYSEADIWAELNRRHQNSIFQIAAVEYSCLFPDGVLYPEEKLVL